MKKSVALFIFVIYLLNLISVSASLLGIFEQGTTISLHQICDNCTFVNLTSVKFPNGTIQNFNVDMTKVGNDYNYSFSSTNSMGSYSYNTCGDQDGTLLCENIDFIINPLGEELTTGKGIIYILLTLLVFILFLFVLYINIALPMENEKNNQGQTIKIIRKKYIKIALIPVTYTLFIWFLNLLLGISNNLVSEFDIYYGMISFLFLIFVRLSWVVWVVCLVWFMFNWIRDLHWNKQIKKFGRVIK